MINISEEIEDEFEQDLIGELEVENEDDNDYESWLDNQLEVKRTGLCEVSTLEVNTASWLELEDSSVEVTAYTLGLTKELENSKAIASTFEAVIINKPTTDNSTTSDTNTDDCLGIGDDKEFGKEYLSLNEEDRSAVSTSLKGVISAVIAMFEITSESEVSSSHQVTSSSANDPINQELEVERQRMEEKAREDAIKAKEIADQMKSLEERLKFQQEAALKMMEERKIFDEQSKAREVSLSVKQSQLKEKIASQRQEKHKELESALEERKKLSKQLELEYMAAKSKAIREEEDLARQEALKVATKEAERKKFVQQVLAVERLQIASKKWLFKSNMNKRVQASLFKKKRVVAIIIIQSFARRKLACRKFSRLFTLKQERLKVEQRKALVKQQEEERRRKEELDQQKLERKKMEAEERKSKILEVQRRQELAEKKRQEEKEAAERKIVEEKNKRIREEEMKKMRQEEEMKREIELKQQQEQRWVEEKQAMIKQRRAQLVQWNQHKDQRYQSWKQHCCSQAERLHSELQVRQASLGGIIEDNVRKEHFNLIHALEFALQQDTETREGEIVLDALDTELELFGDDAEGKLSSEKRQRQVRTTQRNQSNDASLKTHETNSDDPREALRQQLAEAEERRRALILQALTSGSTNSSDASSDSTHSTPKYGLEWKGPSRLYRLIHSRDEIKSHISRMKLLSSKGDVDKGEDPASWIETRHNEDKEAETQVLETLRFIGLGDLSKVVSLELDVENISHGLGALKIMNSLTSLSLSVNKISSLEESGLLKLSYSNRLAAANPTNSLKVFPLRRLCLRDNKLRSLKGMGEAFRANFRDGSLVGGLEDLSVDVNELNKLDPEHINPLSSTLRQLSVSANKLLAFPEGLNLHQLNHMDMSHNKISYLPMGCMEHLVSLTSLDLCRNELSVASGKALSHAKCLVSLSLSRNKLKEPPFPLRLPLLKKLYMGSNRIENLDLWSSSVRPRSRPPSAQDSQLMDDIGEAPIEATWLPSLEFLSLENNAINHLKPGCFVGMPNLQSLDLVLNLLKYDQSTNTQFPSLEGLWSPKYSTSKLLLLKLKENPIADILPSPLSSSASTTPSQAPINTTLIVEEGNREGVDASEEREGNTNNTGAAQAAPHVAPLPEWESPLLAILCVKVPSLRMVDEHLIGPCRTMIANISALTSYDVKDEGFSLIEALRSRTIQRCKIADCEFEVGAHMLNKEEVAMMKAEREHSDKRQNRKRNEFRVLTSEAGKNTKSSPRGTSPTLRWKNQLMHQMWQSRGWKCKVCHGSIQPHNIDSTELISQSKERSKQRCCSQCGTLHVIPSQPALDNVLLLNIVKELSHCEGCDQKSCRHSSTCTYNGIMGNISKHGRELNEALDLHHREHDEKILLGCDSEVVDEGRSNETVPHWLKGSQGNAWLKLDRQHRSSLKLKHCLLSALEAHSQMLNSDMGALAWPGWHISSNAHVEVSKRQEEAKRKRQIEVEKAKNIVATFCQKSYRGRVVRKWWCSKAGKKMLLKMFKARRNSASAIARTWRGYRVRRQLNRALASAAWNDPEVDALLLGGGLGDMAAFLKELSNDGSDVHLSTNKSKVWAKNIASNKGKSPQLVQNMRDHRIQAHNLYGDMNDEQEAEKDDQRIDYTAYDELGPSVSRQHSRLHSASSSTVSEVSLHSAHWGDTTKDLKLPPTRMNLPVKSSPINTARSSSSTSLPSIVRSGTQSARDREEEATRKVMSEWSLSNPNVANAVLMRQDHIKRAEKEAAQREKEKDPVYRYQKLMRKVAHTNQLDATGVAKPSESSNKKKKKFSGDSSSGGWGMRSSVAQERARNLKRKKGRGLPAAWTMPPIDQKE